MAFLGLDAFYAAAANGTLPLITYIVGPTELSEHPPYSPRDGAWLQKQVVDAVTSSPLYPNTALIISWDECGGLGDHVVPYHSPDGTPGEWLEDPLGKFGRVYQGPGFRLPFYIVSPWTRGGNVFTEHADHNSQILFVEKWLAAKGFSNVTTTQMVQWRRDHMSDLTSAFDFDHPDLSVPILPFAIPPHVNAQGQFDGSSFCEATFPVQRPPVPYGKQNTDMAALSEEGFKSLRGSLTEGRFLVFEMNGFALADTGSRWNLWGGLSATRASRKHEDIAQRWVAHVETLGSDKFTITSAKDGNWISSSLALTPNPDDAITVTVNFVASQGYSLEVPGFGSTQFITIDKWGNVGLSAEPAYFDLFSVTYH